MSGIGRRTQKEFEADFPLDFGSGHRGDFIHHRDRVVGIIEAHVDKNGDTCGGSIYWKAVRPNQITWELRSLEPLTLAPSIQCDCGVHGFIENGKWRDA